MAELWSISSLTRGWYDTRAKHPYRVARPGKPRPRDRIAYNSLYPYQRTLSQWIQPSTVSNLPLPVSSVRLSFAPSLSSTLSSLLCVMYRSMLGHVCPYSRLYTRGCVYRSSFGRRWEAVVCFLSLSLWTGTKVLIDNIARMHENWPEQRLTTLENSLTPGKNDRS